MQFFPRRCIRYSMKIIEYDRDAAVAYARQWAFARNPQYYDFSRIGGDCTNFASQCLFAGCKVMNFTPDIGWYYRSQDDRSAAWTGVEYFYNFLTGNFGNGFGNPFVQNHAEKYGNVIGNGSGPFAIVTELADLEIGDFIQFGRGTGDFYHTPIVVGFADGEPLLAAHSYDGYNRPLRTYSYEKIRCLHIVGARSV